MKYTIAQVHITSLQRVVEMAVYSIVATKVGTSSSESMEYSNHIVFLVSFKHFAYTIKIWTG